MADEVLVAEIDTSGGQNNGSNDQKTSADGDAQSSSAIIELFGRVFEENDLNHDGVIDFGEWKNIIQNHKELGLSFISSKDSFHIFQTLTTDGKNIDYKKFVTNMKSFQSSHSGLSGDDFLMGFLAGHYEHAKSPQTVSQSVGAQGMGMGTIHEQGFSPSIPSLYGGQLVNEAKDATIADLRKKIEELEKYQIQCETLEVKLEQKENKISQLQGELRYAEEELQVYKEHKESLEEDNEQLRNANSELSSQIKELSDNFTEVEALLKRSEESANQGNAEAYAKHLEQTNSLLETEKELNRQLQENMTKMSENQNRLNKRYSSLEAQLDEKRRELNEIVNEYSSLKETATELAAKNNNLEAAVNELENELAEKEQEQNEVIQQYRPPSPTNIQQIQQFDAGPPARNRARTSIVPPPTNQQQNGGIAPITPIDLEYTLIRQNTHGGYDSGDFSDAFDDIVDDDVESEKLEKWRRLRSSALEKRRQSKMMHSRNNSAYSGLNLYDSASNNRLGGGQMNANFEKMFQEMNEKMVKELGEQFVEFKKSMEYDFKEIKDLVVNIESGQGGGDGHRDSIEDAREQLKWTQDALTAPSIQDQLSNIEKVQKEHSEHVRNQTTELIEDFQNEMDDKSAKMDELMSLMSAQLVETEHQTQDYLDKKMEQLFDNLKQELNGNSKNSKRQGMETIEEEDTKSGEILNKNAVENLVNQFSSLIDTKINEQNKNIMDNNEYNKTQLYNAIDAVSKTLSNFANYFNITGDGSDNNHNNNNNNNNGVTFFSKIGEMLSQTQSAIVNQTTSTIENNNATNHENILREFEEKLDVESSITPANNDLLDTIVSDKVKTVEILGKQMDILREQIKFAHKQNTTLSDIAKRQQSSLHQAQNQGLLAKLGLGGWSSIG